MKDTHTQIIIILLGLLTVGIFACALFLSRTTDRYVARRYNEPIRDTVKNTNTPLDHFIESEPLEVVPPLVEVTWEKVGLLISTNDEGDKTILDLYQRTVSHLMDAYEYAIEDKNGFIIPIKNGSNGFYYYLEDGDIIDEVLGYENSGKFKVNLFNRGIVIR